MTASPPPADALREALTMTQQERGRRLTDEEIDSWVADQQTPARHGTASVAIEIAYELHERLAGVGGRLAAAPAPGLNCSNCGEPMTAHCRKHSLPCCPHYPQHKAPQND